MIILIFFWHIGFFFNNHFIWTRLWETQNSLVLQVSFKGVLEQKLNL
jgi:hypothetical protein